MAPTLLSIWDWPTRMRTLEARMETQKLSRMMERSDLMNLQAGAAWGWGASLYHVPVPCPLHAAGGWALSWARDSARQPGAPLPPGCHLDYSLPATSHLITLMLSLCLHHTPLCRPLPTWSHAPGAPRVPSCPQVTSRRQRRSPAGSAGPCRRRHSRSSAALTGCPRGPWPGGEQGG